MDYLALLGCNGGSRRDGVGRVNKEGNKNLANSRLCWVFETERLDLVLIYVWEGDATALDGFNTSEILQTFVIAG
jgi:hypothetical protein